MFLCTRNSPRLINGRISFLSMSQLDRKSYSQRTFLSRKPLKKIIPSTRKTEVVGKKPHVFVTEAEKVAKEAEKRMKFVTKHLKKIEKDIENENEEEGNEINDEEISTKVPYKQIDLSTLPKFERILGWDKQNRQLKELKRELSYKMKKNHDVIILEGKRLIMEAMHEGLYPKSFVFSRVNLLDEFPFDKSRPLNLVQIPYSNISTWTELSTSPGFMASFDKKEVVEHIQQKEENSDSIPVTLILDNIRTPDNLGSLIRVAAASGCRKIIAMHGCCDVWSPKALRSAAGAHFHIPLFSGIKWDSVHKYLPRNAPVYLADNISAGHNCSTTEESVNFEQLRELSSQTKQFMVQSTEAGTDYLDMSYYEQDILDQYESLEVPQLPVFKLDNVSECVVVFGGESHGISKMAKKLALENYGQKIFVPIKNSVESLNVVSAASVILFQLQAKTIQSGN